MFYLQLLLGVVVMVAIAVLVATAKGDRLRIPHAGPARLGSAIGERLLLLRSPGSAGQLVWEVPRDELIGVTAGPRTGLLSRFRLEFADGSSAAVLTPNPSTAGLLQRHLAPAA